MTTLADAARGANSPVDTASVANLRLMLRRAESTRDVSASSWCRGVRIRWSVPIAAPNC